MKLRHLLSFAFTASFVACSLFSSAQHRFLPHSIELKTGIIVPGENFTDLSKQLMTHAPEETVNGRYYCYLQFEEIPNSAQREAMMATGVKFFDYLPHKTYIASFPAVYDLGTLAPYQVRSVINIEPAYKMAKALYERPLPAHAVVGDEVEINIQYYADLSPIEVANLLDQEGFTVIGRYDYGNKYSLRIPIADIERVAQLPYVAYLEPIDPPAEPELYTARTNHRSNVMASDHPMGRQYDGTGVHVVMGDDGIIGPHIDYTGRVDQANVGSNNGDHGDHVAGIIMSAGNLDPKGRGMAFGADLYVYSVWNGVNESPQTYGQDSIRITSTSYGNGCNAGYTSFAQDADQMIRQYPSLMHVFSAGNSGSDDCGYGAGSGWGNVTGGVKAGKNVTAVANLNSIDGLANSSSRGPADDGRIKPDVAAVGSSVYSTVDVNTYDVKSGTSMAAPGVSGTYAQLYHAYRVLNGVDPDAGLMKAVLMNSADDLGNDGPDYKFGFGRINASRAVRILEDGNIQSFDLDQGDNINTSITVPAGTQEVKIMVYWTDYEGSTSASLALVNDINMIVTDPNNVDYNPWILDPTPNATNLDMPATRGIDNLNNVEQVTIDAPVAGTYNIELDGFQIPQGPQTCFIVYEFIGEEVMLTYPIGGEGFVPGEAEYIRWDAYGSSGTFDLEYSVDNGASWSTIVSNLPGNSRYYQWNVPSATTTGEAMVRVTRGTFSDVSANPFSIIRLPLNLTIDWVCPDSLQLSWNSVVDATGYEIFQLGSKYMDSVGTSTGTSFVVTGTNPSVTDWFSVRALGPNGAKGRRAIAIEKQPGVVNCQLPDDASLASILSPGQGSLQSCNNLDSVQVTVLIENPGVTDISNIPVSYNLAGPGGGTVNETFTGTIAAGTTAQHTFAAMVSMNPNTPYTISAWVNYPSDPNFTNDSTSATIQTVSSGTVVTLPWSDDFEDNNPCGSQNNCESTTCTIANGWLNDSNISVDDIDWREDNEGTPSDGTGPNEDHNPGTSDGIYLFLEASGGCTFREAYLTTPCIDLSNTSIPTLEFWYHANGQHMGELHIDVLVGTTWNLDVIPVISGNQGNVWRQELVDLSAFSGEIINVRFRGVTGEDFASDIAIDDVSMYDVVSVPEQALLDASIDVYPNPNDGQFTLSWNTEVSDVLKVNVYGMLGSVVLEQEINAASGQAQLQLPSLSFGMFVVEVETTKGKSYQQVIVH